MALGMQKKEFVWESNWAFENLADLFFFPRKSVVGLIQKSLVGTMGMKSYTFREMSNFRKNTHILANNTTVSDRSIFSSSSNFNLFVANDGMARLNPDTKGGT